MTDQERFDKLVELCIERPNEDHDPMFQWTSLSAVGYALWSAVAFGSYDNIKEHEGTVDMDSSKILVQHRLVDNMQHTRPTQLGRDVLEQARLIVVLAHN